jgi:hypothetical protein
MFNMSTETRMPQQLGEEVEDLMDETLVKRTLRLMCRKGAHLTTTRAQKLLYLIEREFFLDTGRRCLGLDYRYDRFGMYSPSLNHLLTNLSPANDGLEVKGVETERGAGRMIDCRGSRVDDHLPEPMERAVATVLAEYGFLNTPALIAAAKETSPFIYAKLGESLDWSKLEDERCRPGEELSDQGRRKLDVAMKSGESRKSPTFDTVQDLIQYLFS